MSEDAKTGGQGEANELGIRVRAYEKRDAARWNELVAGSSHATFLQSRRFLDYHGDRFEDLSLMFWDYRGRLKAIFPGARDLDDSSCVVSHPGATYGGLVAEGHLSPRLYRVLISQLCGYYRDEKIGIARVLYRSLPFHLQRIPMQLDHHALWQAGARVVGRELWNVISVQEPRKCSKGHKWSLGQARKQGLELREMHGSEGYAQAHALLAQCLQERHARAPVHSCLEMIDLHDRLGERVSLWGAWRGNELLAMTWLFHHGSSAWHAQYIASSRSGRDCGAVVFLLNETLLRAEKENIRYFSFGASSEEGGRRVNEGLFQHKASFGQGCVLHESYLLDTELVR